MYKHRVKRMGGGAAIRIFYNLSLRTSHYLSPEGGLGGRFFLGGRGSQSFEGEGSPTEFKEDCRTFTANQLPMRGRVIIRDRAFGEAGIRSILSGHNQNLQPLPFPGGK